MTFGKHIRKGKQTHGTTDYEGLHRPEECRDRRFQVCRLEAARVRRGSRLRQDSGEQGDNSAAREVGASFEVCDTDGAGRSGTEHAGSDKPVCEEVPDIEQTHRRGVQVKFFFLRQWKPLPRVSSDRGNGHKPTPYPNIDGLLAGVVSRGACTLHELKTIYSLEDVKWMEEAYYMPEYNEYMARERSRRKADIRRKGF